MSDIDTKSLVVIACCGPIIGLVIFSPAVENFFALQLH